MTPRADELIGIIRQVPWLLEVLTTARSLGLPDWYVGAGAVRDVVWDIRFGHGFDPVNIRDIDLVYFDASDLDSATERDRLMEARLPPGWDVKNQAAVHTWFHRRFGGEPVEPLLSTVEGIATWPETATAVAVRLEVDESLTIAAPHGLDDLLDGVWRRNPVRVSDEEASRRLERKNVAERWPGLRVASE